jgi:hypothetical protein
MNNLNKNNSISKSIISNNNSFVFNKNNVNVVSSQSKKLSRTKKNINKKKYLNIKDYKKIKRISAVKEINNKNIIEYPEGNKYKCIGPCYPANMLYYHPLTLQAIKSKSISCPIKQQKIGNKIKIKDKCTLNPDYDFSNYDMFADIVQIATSDKLFLEQIYNIKNIYDVELFINNNIKQLPLLSQKRILNSIYKVYRDNDAFPNEDFIKLIKNIIYDVFNIKIKSKNILSKIMNNKYNDYHNDLFIFLIS